MVLEPDVPLVVYSVVGPVSKLAFGDKLSPLRGSKFVLDNIQAVQPIFDVVSLTRDARLIPVASRPCSIHRWRVQSVVRSR